MATLVPMSDEAFDTYFEQAIEGYAQDNVDSGRWPEEYALQWSRADLEESLPQGLDTPNNYLFEIVSGDGGDSVGALWFAVTEQHDTKSAFVYDIEIAPKHRRKGFAAAAFRALETAAGELGLTNIGLHVFHHNAEAIALYNKLGFRATGLNMLKDIRPKSS